eukprot:TRINITY_DN44412_c0_g1_i1.p1 TRINITY_DN44412_c0_g1~~TRINITY_DN44412_c0_g1_i1.p1  ORF type:complete len:344 (+),score=61.01 TRINITY_DN44412_c0_g1_i1:141-1172(+)
MGLASLAERLAACRAEVAACDPDLNPTAFDVVMTKDAPGQHLSFDQVRTNWKAHKQLHLKVLEQLRLCQRLGSAADQSWSSQDPPAIAATRAEVREEVMTMKKRVEKESVLHNRLHKEVAEAYSHVQRLRDLCTEEIEKLPFGSDLDSTDTTDAEIIEAGGAAELAKSKQRTYDALASAAAEEASRLQRHAAERASRKRELEAELRRLKEQQAADSKIERSCRRDALREVETRAANERLLLAQGTLGFPSLEFDDTRGLIVLAPPHGAGPASTGKLAAAIRSSVPRVERTIAVTWDANGRLASAEAHPRLQLQTEAVAAVAQDDLGRLLTAVWAEITRAAALR